LLDEKHSGFVLHNLFLKTSKICRKNVST